MLFSFKKVLLFLFLSLLIANTAAAFEVVISKNEVVTSSELYLGEIAEIRGAELKPEKLNQLKMLRLTSSPQPGYQKLINRVLVELSIKNLGYQNSDFKVKMPKKTNVARKSSVVARSKIRAFVEEKLINQLQLAADKIIIEELNNPDKYQTAAGGYTLQLASHSLFKFGKNNTALELIQKGRVQKRIYYRFKLGVKSNVLQAVRDLPYKSALNRNDFKLVEKIIYQNPEQITTDWRKIEQKELKTTLKKGDYLRSKLIKNPYLVQWGDRLKVTIVKNNVVLSSFVTARERGKMGDEITVENEKSGYRFQAEVSSENEVKYISP